MATSDASNAAAQSGGTGGSRGQRIPTRCGVLGCMKWSQGKKCNFMCCAHFTESNGGIPALFRTEECSVEGCVKYHRGKMCNYMCHRHFNKSTEAAALAAEDMPTFHEPPTSAAAPLTAAAIISTPSLTPHDVLSGRGQKIQNHPGNRLFRTIVASRRHDYVHAARHRDKQAIAREIVDYVRGRGGMVYTLGSGATADGGNGEERGRGEVVVAVEGMGDGGLRPPGRFVEPAIVAHPDLWRPMSDAAACEKVKQAFRNLSKGLISDPRVQSEFVVGSGGGGTAGTAGAGGRVIRTEAAALAVRQREAKSNAKAVTAEDIRTEAAALAVRQREARRQSNAEYFDYVDPDAAGEDEEDAAYTALSTGGINFDRVGEQAAV